MRGKRTNGLKVVVTTTRRYIDVPSSRARDLHHYLRQNYVQSAPPEPSTSDFDSIELTKGSDVKVVQALLDRWE